MSQPNVLITPTLLNAYEFAKGAPPSWKKRAYSSFVAKLRREKYTMSPEAKKGIEFENAVFRVCEETIRKKNCTVLKGSKLFQSVANSCIGGKFQKVVKRYMRVDNELVCYYGKLDVLFPERIIDIKTTGTYKGDKKYLGGWQHIFYLWASQLTEFHYLVVEWDNKVENKISELHPIEYKNTDLGEMENKLTQVTRDLFKFLYDHDLYDDYYFTFSNNEKR